MSQPRIECRYNDNGYDDSKTYPDNHDVLIFLFRATGFGEGGGGVLTI
jgi:hypothetical protein